MAAIAAAQRTLTFEQATTAYHAHHESKWKNERHVTQFMASLKEYAFPIFGALPLNAIETHHVLKVLEQRVEAYKGKPRQALGHAARNRISRKAQD